MSPRLRKHAARLLAAVIALALLLGALAPASQADTQAPVPVRLTLDQVVKHVSETNYEVYENAIKVYQARESIKVSRANLLPKLNLWGVADAALGMTLGAFGGSWLDTASGSTPLLQDVAPFLVPGNWFRVAEMKLLHLASAEAYRALWANEVMSAKGVYHQILLDRELLRLVGEERARLVEIRAIAETRELFGGDASGGAREAELRILSLEEDLRALEVMTRDESTRLAFALGLPVSGGLDPAPVPMPETDRLPPLDVEDFEFRAVNGSPESREFGILITVLPLIKKEIKWSFLGVSTMSRGAEGGIFDHLPIQDGLGFGRNASLRIVDSQGEVMRVQKRAIEETVRRTLRTSVDKYNLDIENLKSLKRRQALTRHTLEEQRARLKLGEPVAIRELIEASRGQLVSDLALAGVRHRFQVTRDRIDRILFHGDYTKTPAAIAELKCGQAGNAACVVRR